MRQTQKLVDKFCVIRKYPSMQTQIRQKRRGLGLSLLDAARQLETDSGNLSRIERGIQVPSISLAKRISAILGLTLDEIYAQTPSCRGGDGVCCDVDKR
jgi:transcriptional regulator with XRE-family HTH domain